MVSGFDIMQCSCLLEQHFWLMLNSSLDVIVPYQVYHHDSDADDFRKQLVGLCATTCLPHQVKFRTRSCPLHLHVALQWWHQNDRKNKLSLHYASVHWMSSKENHVLSVTCFLALWSKPVCCPSECQRQVSTPTVLYTWMVKRKDSFGGSGPKAKNHKNAVGEKWPHIKRITEWFLDSI